MPTLREYLLTKLAEFNLEPADIAAVIVPVDDPRVPTGELRVTPQAFGQAAQLVDVTEARRDILVELQPNAVDAEGVPIIPPPAARTVGWVDGDFRVVRGPGASPYPFGPDDLLAGA